MGYSRLCCMESCTILLEPQNLFWLGVYSWLRSLLIRFNTSLQRSLFTVTVSLLLPPSQYGPSFPFFAFNVQRAVTFVPFKHHSPPFSSGLSLPSTHCYGDYSSIQVKMDLISKPIFDYPILQTIPIRSATLLHISVHFCLSVSMSLWHADILYATYFGPFLAFAEELLLLYQAVNS